MRVDTRVLIIKRCPYFGSPYVYMHYVIFHACAAVQFNFRKSELVISEGGNLPSHLSIVKTGQQTDGSTINIHVNITTVTPNNNGMRHCVWETCICVARVFLLTLFIHFMFTDYVPNADHIYNFNSEIGSLPIATVAITDRQDR